MKRFLQAALLIVLCVLGMKLRAHEWYDPACCNERDCAPIPATSVERTKEGKWRVVLYPGQHPMVSTPFIGEVKATRRSQDSDFHACIYRLEDGSQSFLCLYEPELTQ